MNTQSPLQWTILAILKWTTGYFQDKQIQNPRLTAEVLLAHTLQKERIYLYTHFDQPLEEEERTQYRGLIKQRIQGVPTQYLVGKQEFWSMSFQVAPGVLIPRAETEHLVEAAIDCAKAFPQPKILDIGTGSGIIAISVKKELPHAEVHASDLSEQALAIARQNASVLLNSDTTILFHHGDLFAPFAEMRFDIIISNPPYISDEEYAALAPEIQAHEPREALWAGEKGLDVYKRLIPAARPYLNPKGYVLVEIGYGQKEAVSALFQQHEYVVREVIPDYAGIDRVIVARFTQ